MGDVLFFYCVNFLRRVLVFVSLVVYSLYSGLIWSMPIVGVSFRTAVEDYKMYDSITEGT